MDLCREWVSDIEQDRRPGWSDVPVGYGMSGTTECAGDPKRASGILDKSKTSTF